MGVVAVVVVRMVPKVLVCQIYESGEREDYETKYFENISAT